MLVISINNFVRSVSFFRVSKKDWFLVVDIGYDKWTREDLTVEPFMENKCVSGLVIHSYFRIR